MRLDSKFETPILIWTLISNLKALGLSNIQMYLHKKNLHPVIDSTKHRFVTLTAWNIHVGEPTCHFVKVNFVNLYFYGINIWHIIRHKNIFSNTSQYFKRQTGNVCFIYMYLHGIIHIQNLLLYELCRT